MAQPSQAKPPAIPPDTAKYTVHLPSIAEMKAFKNNFTFDDASAPHNFFVLLSSLPKIGKTHLACTMSELEPTYLLDTEYKGGEVAHKFLPTGNMYYKIIHNFVEMAAAVRYITKNEKGDCPKGCIILDSGSDLQTFAEELYLLEMGKDSVGLPRNWADVFSKCNALIKEIKAAGFDLILTTRMKEEYKMNAPTGRVVPRIWDNASYLADVAVEWDMEKKPWVKLNAFRKQTEPIPMTARSIGELIAQLKEQKLAPPQIKAA
jgi:hypothetical protein